ncbi:curli assembly protein CsgF [Chryseobacterium sp. T1]
MKIITHIQKILFLSFFLLGFGFCFSQQMVYQPVNPAFGGNYLNYSWLLNSANSQNQFASAKNLGMRSNSSIGNFADSLNRQILSQISRGLFGGELGTATMKPGVYNLGTMNISISEYFGGLNISIIDINTGEQTNINVPSNK